MNTALTEACQECLNYFAKSVQSGEFIIGDGKIEGLIPLPLHGQYIRIIGSVFNDGIFKYGESFKQNESFTGTVWLLAIPPAFLKLVDEIKAFQEMNDSAKSALVSEKIGSNYSYTKAVGDNGLVAGWQDVFRSQLNNFRRMTEERP